MTRQVAVTGMGVATSLGLDVDTLWQNLLQGKNSASLVTSFDTSQYPHHMGCEIKQFHSEFISEPENRVYGRGSKFAIHAAHEAQRSANLENLNSEWRRRTGVIIGTTYGEAQIVERATSAYINGTQNSKKVGPLKQYSPNSIAVNVAKKFNLFGPVMVMPTACAAGNYAIGYGSLFIREGRADLMLVGGADPFSHASFSGFSRLGAMSETVCRPFDKNRQGMLIGEGAGILILEEYEHAKKRGAKIYALIQSLGLSCDANHMTIPSVDGVTMMMQDALGRAGISAEDIDYICAHGTGTPMNDKTESEAISRLFYQKGNSVPVSSVKSMLGHSMGAASAIEAIVSVLAIEHGEIPPTANFETPDPMCQIDCVPNVPRRKKIKRVLNNSLAFGGNNACVILGSP